LYASRLGEFAGTGAGVALRWKRWETPETALEVTLATPEATPPTTLHPHKLARIRKEAALVRMVVFMVVSQIIVAIQRQDRARA
jgi:hypothetical protein